VRSHECGSRRGAILPSIIGCGAALFFTCLPLQTARRDRPPFDPSSAIPAQWRDEPVVILADSTRYSFSAGPEGAALALREIVWYYVNKRNPTELETIVVKECETTEGRPSIDATIYYPDGTSATIDEGQISRFRKTSEEGYSSNTFINSFDVPRYEAGIMVRLDVRRTSPHPEFYSRETLRSEYPVVNRFVEIATPKGAAVNRKLYNRESLTLDTAARTGPDSGAVFTITGTNLKKLPDYHSVTLPEAWFAAIDCSFPPAGRRSPSWRELGDYYLTLIEPSLVKRSRVAALADGLGGGDPDSVAKQAYLLVRRAVRYHSDFEKMHAIVPQPVDETVEKGYGDCKEMSSLLAALLSAKGVECGLALVAAPGKQQAHDDVPTLDHFNHVTVYYTKANGERRILDPTVDFGDPFDSYCWLVGQKALFLKKGASVFGTVAPQSNYRNAVRTSSVITAENGGWKITGTILLLGRAAHRSYQIFHALRKQEETPFVKEFLAKAFGLDAQSARLGAVRGDSVEIRYEADDGKNYLPLERGGLRLTSPSIVGGGIAYTTIETEGPRGFDAFTQEDVWQIPEGFGEFESGDFSYKSIATGAWKRDGPGRIIRTYAQDDGGAPVYDRDAIKTYFAKRKSFDCPTLWR
jgi:transglutaminase-like putative cysteine protease